MVISGWEFNDISVNLEKRKLNELVDTTPIQDVTLERFKGKSESITFYLEEFPRGSPNSSIPLLVRVKMANFDVHQILDDEGIFVNVVYTHLICTL